MCDFKKRKRYNEEEDDPIKGESLYLRLRSRCGQMNVELKQVSLTLHLTEQREKDANAHLEQALKALQDTHRMKEELASELEVVRTQHDAHLELALKALWDTHRMKEELASELESMRTQQHQETNIMAACRTQIEGLKASIIIGADAYDAMKAKVADLQQEIQEVKIENANDNVFQRRAERAVCRHFGWSKKTADPVLFRAAVGFWDACSHPGNEVGSRNSMQIRKDICWS